MTSTKFTVVLKVTGLKSQNYVHYNESSGFQCDIGLKSGVFRMYYDMI